MVGPAGAHREAHGGGHPPEVWTTETPWLLRCGSRNIETRRLRLCVLDCQCGLAYVWRVWGAALSTTPPLQPAAGFQGWETHPGRLRVQRSAPNPAISAARTLPPATQQPVPPLFAATLSYTSGPHTGKARVRHGTDLWDRCAGVVALGNCPGSALARV